MSQLITAIFFLIFFANYSNANEKNSFIKNICEWENKINEPCITISKSLPNSSKFTKTNINKTIISRQDIENSGAVDLVDLLKGIPDLNITRSGPIGQQASIFSRGSGSNHTLVMINGIPINDQSTTQGLHDFGIDFIQTIQQVEIYPGSTGTLFGTNAIGGAINIVLTGDYKDSISVSSDSEANYDIFSNKTFFYDNSSNLNLKFGSVNNETISARGKKDDEKDGVKNYSGNLNYEKFINSNIKIFNTIYLRQTVAEYDNSSTNQTGYEGNNKMGSLHFGIENLEEERYDKFVIYKNIYDREYDERGTIDTYKSNVLGIKYDFTNTLNDKFSIGLGTNYNYDWGEFDNNGSYEASTKGNTDNLALYGNFGYNINKISNISLFFRNDNHKYTKNNQTYKIDLSNKLKNIKFGTSYATGIRNPTLYELFGTDSYGYSGNRNLKAEKSNTYEIYSKAKITNNLYFGARAFKSNIKNNIEYVSNKYVNDNDDVNLNQSGSNFEINYLTKELDIKSYTSFLSSKKENGSSQLRRPDKKYGLNISKLFKKTIIGDFKINFNYNHYGKHYDTHSTSFSTIEMDSTDIIDLKLSKKFNNADYFVTINNLFDENYERPHGYNQEQRSLRFGYKF